MSSMSPKVWHDAHEASPLADERWASYRKGRPATMLAGSGLVSTALATSVRLLRLMTLIALSKRVITYRRLRASSSTRPLGPPPLTVM